MGVKSYFYSTSCVALLFVGTDVVAANVYVPNYGSANISVVGTSTNTVTATINVGNNPNATAVTPDGLYLYVPNNLDGTVSVINTANNSVIATLTVGLGPSSVAITPNGNYAYITNQNDSSISIIKNASTGTPTVIGDLLIDTGAVAIAIASNGNYGYVTDNNGPSGIAYQLINLSTGSPSVGASIGVGDTPVAVAITPNGNYAYIVNYGNGASNSQVSVIQNASTNSPTIIATVTVGISPVAAAVTPNGNYAYISNLGTSAISILGNASSGNPSVVNTVTIPGSFNPYATAFTQNGQIAYVSNQGAGSVAVFQNASTNNPTFLTTVSVGSLPSNSGCMGLSAPHQVALVNSAGSNLYTIDQTSLSSLPVSLSLGSSISPQSIVLTNDRMYAYVTQNVSNPGLVSYIAMDYENLYPIRVAGSISVGINPISMVLSPDGSYIYVIDQGAPATVYRIALSNNSATLLESLASEPANIGVDPTGSYLVVTLPADGDVVVISSPSGTPTMTTVPVGIGPNAVAFDNSGYAYVTCSGSSELYKINLSTKSTTSLALSGTSPGAISTLSIGGTIYLLVAMNDSANVNLVNASTFTITSSPSIASAATQIVVNPNTSSVAYLIEPSTNSVQSIDFTSSTTSPTISSQVATGSNPVGGGCNASGTQLFILNHQAGSLSAYNLSGTNQRTITAASGSPITGLGAPQGISVCP